MSVIGYATEHDAVQGNIGSPKYLRGASAYEVAVMNGYSGSEEEWLLSLKGGAFVDATLSIEGVAADSKVTGDAIRAYEAAIVAATEAGRSAESKAFTAANKADNAKGTIDTHISNKQNPHAVTAKQLGLGNVDNTADLDKPVSTEQAKAIADAKKAGTYAQTAADNAQATADDALECANNAYAVANVLQYGAIGDGVTDDSEAIQRAFDSGLTVVFPAGKYKFKGITCNHSVDVIFENAELVPIFRKEHVIDDPQRYSGVINRMFIFEDCEKVTMTGLKIVCEENDYEKAGEGVAKHNTESIAEFHRCTKVLISGWNVQNLNYWNRGNNGGEFYDRKGIIFTAIDTEVVVENCYFKNMAYDEWTWITYKDNLAGSKATFKNCHFQKAVNTLSCVGILAHTATVVDCVFENINNYDKINDKYYTLANLLSLYGNFSNNLIKDCVIGGVCDFREGSLVFTTYAKIHNNQMVNSTCNKFASVSGKDVHITNNIAAAKVFCYSHNPLEGNILREEGEVTKIRYVIENNVAEVFDYESVSSEYACMFFRFSNFVEGLWNSSDSEVMCRNNRFFSNKKGLKNANLIAVDVGRLIMHDNILYMGIRNQATEDLYSTVQLSCVNLEDVTVDFVGNKIEMNTVNTATVKTNPYLLHIARGYVNAKVNAFYNSVRSVGMQPSLASGYAEGSLQLDGQANINISGANNNS